MPSSSARAQGSNIKVARLPVLRVARTLEVDETRGLMKAVVDSATGRIMGCAVLGIEGGAVTAVLFASMDVCPMGR
jgi:pyruvate/2-oxoglutarate dehydrogenase complex dihydrolipoamide dehydrogenase (E3) component